MRFYSVFILTLFFPTFLFSQKQNDSLPKFTSTKAENNCHCGVGFQLNIGEYEKPKTGTLEFVKKFGRGYTGSRPTLHYRNQLTSIGSEFGFRKDDFVLGPKMTYEFTWLFLSARSEFIWYTNFKSSDPRLSLGGGIAFFGWVGFYYVYQIPLSKNQIWEVNTNKFSLTFRYPFGLPHADIGN